MLGLELNRPCFEQCAVRNRTASRDSGRRLTSGQLNIDRAPGGDGNGNLPILGNDPQDAGERITDPRRDGLVLAEQHPGREFARIAQEVLVLGVPGVGLAVVARAETDVLDQIDQRFGGQRRTRHISDADLVNTAVPAILAHDEGHICRDPFLALRFAGAVEDTEPQLDRLGTNMVIERREAAVLGDDVVALPGSNIEAHVAELMQRFIPAIASVCGMVLDEVWAQRVRAQRALQSLCNIGSDLIPDSRSGMCKRLIHSDWHRKWRCLRINAQSTRN